MAHEPQLVSIKIGINDVWHGLGEAGGGTSIEKFQRFYVEILERLRDALPEVTMVLCEPTIGRPPPQGNKALAPYVTAVRELGAKFEARAVVPLHDAFNKAGMERPDIEWAPDGVHPSSSGHMLIARSWLASLGLL